MLAGSGSAAVFTCSATSRGSTCLVDRMCRPRPSWNVIACAAEQSASHPTSAAPATSPLIRRRRLTNEVFPGAGAVRPGYRCVTMLRKALTAAEAALTPVGLVADEIPAQQRTLGEQDQRPWPLPERPWLMGQTWYDLLFAHRSEEHTSELQSHSFTSYAVFCFTKKSHRPPWGERRRLPLQSSSSLVFTPE